MTDESGFADFGINEELGNKINLFLVSDTSKIDAIVLLTILSSILESRDGKISMEEILVLVNAYAGSMIYKYLMRDEQVVKTTEQLFGGKMSGDNDAS